MTIRPDVGIMSFWLCNDNRLHCGTGGDNGDFVFQKYGVGIREGELETRKDVCEATVHFGS